MPRRTQRQIPSSPQTMSLRTRLALGFLAFLTLVGTGLVVAPVAMIG